MSDFLEEWIEDPIKLWGSVLIVFGLLFYIFSGSSGNNVNNYVDDPFTQESSFVSQEQIAQADEEDPEFESEDSFVSEDDMQQDNTEDSFAEENQFDTQKPLTYKKAVIDTKTGLIQYKEFDMQGHEIKEESPKIDKDKKIEQLEKRIGKLESKLDKDPFSN